MTLALQIKEKAKELGFHQTGIARVEILTGEGERLKTWLAKGYNGTMDWMNRSVDKRCDPSLVLPNARSIISVAMNYYTDNHHVETEGTGKVSRYAWGDDYHDILENRLE